MNTTHSNAQPTDYPHIVKTDGVLGGEAAIEGTRIAVWHIVGYYYKVGLSVEAIVAEWNYLKPAQVFSALAYYHDHKAEVDAVREANSYEQWQQEQLTHAAAQIAFERTVIAAVSRTIVGV
jgi:uncharacterized protein (DUF433 family)